MSKTKQENLDFLPEKKFYDEVNYPHGFSRSGDYTVRESAALEDYGTRLQLLESGSAKPANEVEEHFLKAKAGEASELTFIEKTWAKYTRLTTEVKRVYILADNPQTPNDEYGE